MRVVIGSLMALLSWWVIPLETAQVELRPCNIHYKPHGTISHPYPERRLGSWANSTVRAR
jgi:hypothetical protein